MYVLPQAGIIYPTQLKMHLAPFGYKPFQYTPGLWDHENRDTKLCLVVDDFGIKYTRKNNLQHILLALQTQITISVDMKGDLFCRIYLKWDCRKHTV